MKRALLYDKYLYDLKKKKKGSYVRTYISTDYLKVVCLCKNHMEWLGKFSNYISTDPNDVEIVFSLYKLTFPQTQNAHRPPDGTPQSDNPCCHANSLMARGLFRLHLDVT